MKNLKLYCSSFLTLLMVLLLAACEGGGGGSSSGTTQQETPGTLESAPNSLTGTVADGYLWKARVFLDRNGNRVYDSGEPRAISDEGGMFTLSVNSGDGSLYPVVAEVIAGETIDMDTNQPVADSYMLETPPGRWQFVSPLTTLVNLEMKKNPTMTLEKSELNVKRQLGIVDELSLFEDYLAPAPEQAVEAERAHRAAQVVAAVMGSLRRDIADNLAGQTVADQQRLVAYLVSDEIMRQAGTIKKALNQERNLDQTASVSHLITAVREQIDTSDLNRDKLEFYADRIDEDLEVWDMEPPQIEEQNVVAGADVAIDAIITLTFDKALDPASVTNDAVSMRRIGGSAVPGAVDYDAETQRLRFVPDQMLLPYSDYEVVVSTRLQDQLGNPVDNNLSWEFSTIFGLTPPPPVEIDLQ
ncbi:MAG: Ig-like domain-containing protein [Pelovirga sp.]